MIKIKFFLLSFLLLLAMFDICEGNIPLNKSEICISEEEAKLHRLINEYRRSLGLRNIPLSINLTLVAKAHSADLFYNNPDEDYLCNMHSWSEQGNWEACCYTSDHANAECMWNKPREISNYRGDGYEIVFFMSPVTDEISMAKESLEGWKKSPGHNNTIINAGVFRNASWRAIGIGIYKEYVTVWFGELSDDEGAPERCD